MATSANFVHIDGHLIDITAIAAISRVKEDHHESKNRVWFTIYLRGGNNIDIERKSHDRMHSPQEQKTYETEIEAAHELTVGLIDEFIM